MNSTGAQEIGARSGAVARIQFGKPGPYLPLLSEVRWQLLVLESAVALARATVEPTEEGVPPKGDTRALRRAAALIAAVEAALEWARASEGFVGHLYGRRQYLSRRPAGERREDPSTALAPAREKAETALEDFEQVGELRPKEMAAQNLLSAVFTSAQTAERLAVDTHTALERLRKLKAAGAPRREVTLAAERAMKKTASAHRRIGELIGDKAAVERAAIALLPALAYPPGEDLPILRIKQESPLEVVVILIGSAGALVAVLNGLLDIQVKYKTRKEKERAERSRLERELAEDEAKTEAIKKLRTTFSWSEPERLKMQELTVFDSLEEAFEDDEEMKRA